MKKLYGVGPCKTELREEEEPIINKPNYVKIKLTGCGVCMSEHYDWTVGINKTFGHEPVGVVAEVGEKVTRVKVGDRVSGLFDGSAE